MASDNCANIIKVALDIPVPGLFDYLAKDADIGDIGARTIVPFGAKKLTGIVLGISPESDIPVERLKSAEFVFRDIPPLSGKLLDLFRFCSAYYHQPIGQVILNALPARLKTPKSVEINRPRRFSLTDDGLKATVRGRQMRSLIERLKDSPGLNEAEIRETHPAQTLGKLVSLGLVEEIPEKTLPLSISPSPQLTPEQANAVARILQEKDKFHPWLLYGITGSGKTEVYLQVIANILGAGKQVLFLVPEINLTPHLENLFAARFPNTAIVSLHSGLNDTERLQGWLMAQSGKAGIVLGTRLAVFTPLPNPGLIVVDEEHDASFKQQEGLRYSARDVAVFRAKQEAVPIVLGSATPSLESYRSAQTGRYGLLELRHRAIQSATLPRIRYIDLRHEKRKGGLSDKLIEAISLRLNRGEQSMVFLNRRGYSPAMICRACSWTPSCPRCTSRLVLHLKQGRLRCHYCGFEEKIPSACPECGNLDLKPVGHGTQRIESELGSLFPDARILRIDRDSIRKKHDWLNMLDKIRSGEADILIGTQLLAKGHDFPNLTLVGILNSDASLYSSDFRASERLFALLTQVSGRAGRADSPGEVLIQTEYKDHPLYRALEHHDFDAIAAMLLEERSTAGFPPYVHQALIRAEAPVLDRAMGFLEKVRSVASKIAQDVTIFDPAIASMMRLGNMERAHILFQSASRTRLQNFLEALLSNLDPATIRAVKWHIDVDPLEF
jgi:primosomal protein N' (replication factor Y)